MTGNVGQLIFGFFRKCSSNDHARGLGAQNVAENLTVEREVKVGRPSHVANVQRGFGGRMLTMRDTDFRGSV